VLLVEDNEVNQKVAGRVLERMGCTVHIAEHGEAGVAAFMAEPFDLVLMDLQMPVMDGMTAARRIRELETEGDRKRTPIVALTANAMKGDRELCEAAGMDDYLTKPLEVERLRQTLGRFGLAVAAPSSSAPAPRPAYEQSISAHAPPIDLGQLNRLVDGDDEFMRELLVTFLDSGAQQIDDIDAATESFDRSALARAAHKLKGGCANIHAIAMRKLAYEIEAAASTAEKGHLSDLCRQLRLEYARAEKFLNDPSVMPIPIRAAS
jgi:CheY-like chemotaxis protein/HPt (histidine-containing phosphotransfer) domain-containing protein